MTVLLLFFSLIHAANPPYCEDLFKYSCDNRNSGDQGTGTTDVDRNKKKLDGILANTFPAYLQRVRRFAQSRNNRAWSQNLARQINAVAGDVCQPDLACFENGEVKQVMGRLYLRALGLDGTYQDRSFPPQSTPPAGAATPQIAVDYQALDGMLRNAQVRSLATQDRTRIMREMKTEPQGQTQVQQIIPNVRSAAVEYLQSRLPASPQRTAILNRLNSMTIRVNQDPTLSALVEPNASYNGDDNTVTYQGSMLISSNSIFLHAYLLAHEIAHSFDPCTTTGDNLTFQGERPPERSYPFRNVAQCLRRESNIHAMTYEDWRQRNFPGRDANDPFTPQFANETPMYMEGLRRFCEMPHPAVELRRNIEEHIPLKLTVARLRQIQKTCPNLRSYTYRELPYRNTDTPNRTSDNWNRNGGSPSPACGTHDQIGESFCDWFAFQILPGIIDKLTRNRPLSQQQFINGMANLRWYDCEDTRRNSMEIPDFGEHPNGDRRQNVAVVQPEIARRMGCSTHTKFSHCPLQGAPSDAPSGERGVGQ